MKPNRENLTHCPICKGPLYAYSLMGITTAQSCYCPKCDIVRTHYMSTPVVCAECFSEDIYELEGKFYCWFCGSDEIKEFTVTEFYEKKINETEGNKLSLEKVKIKNKCKHKHVTNIRHNEDKFKFTCSDCGYVEYVMLPKWFQEEQGITDHVG